MKRPKRVILHIGMLKTGTTSLQAFLRANVDALAEQGIGFYTKHISPNRSMSNAGFLCWGSLLEAREKNFQNPDYIREMEAFTEYAKGYDTLILSEEFMWEKGIEESKFWGIVKNNIIRMVGADVEISIVAFIRRQDDWILSRWKEYLLNFLSEKPLDFPDYAIRMKKSRLMDYDYALELIAQTFGKEHITVCGYNKSTEVNFDTVNKFLDAACIQLDNIMVKGEDERNVSISIRAAKALLKLSIIDCNKKLSHRSIIRATRLFSIMYPDERKYYPMSEDERESFIQGFDLINSRVASEYNIGDDFFTSDLCCHYEWKDNPQREQQDAEMILKLASISSEKAAFLLQMIGKR